MTVTTEKKIAIAEGIEGNLLPLQQRLAALKENSYLRESRHVDAVRPLVQQFAALDAEQVAAINAGLPAPADILERRMAIVERRASLNHDFEVQCGRDDALIAALSDEVTRLGKELAEVGSTSSMLRDQQKAEKAKADNAVPVKVRIVVAVGTDDWHSLIRAKQVPAGPVPRDGETITVSGTLARQMLARRWAVEVE
ncbi:MAG: hypothetical protein K8T25_01960 [Planctomycetia bacterium]|nr:hypothetical protein [Planctomycetia bacterium]